jgi:hypothetical protein
MDGGLYAVSVCIRLLHLGAVHHFINRNKGNLQMDEDGLPLQSWFYGFLIGEIGDVPRIAHFPSRRLLNPCLLHSSLLAKVKDTRQYILSYRHQVVKIRTCTDPLSAPFILLPASINTTRCRNFPPPVIAARLTVQSYDLKHDLDSFPSS